MDRVKPTAPDANALKPSEPRGAPTRTHVMSYHRDYTPLRLPLDRMPQPPENMEDQAAVEAWLRECRASRNAFMGSGN